MPFTPVWSTAMVVGLAVLLFTLTPHRLSLYFLATGEYPLRSCSGQQTPKLHFASVKSCDQLEMDSKGIPMFEPCVVRGAVDQSRLAEFIALNGDQEFMLTKGFVSNGRIGNPLLDTSFNKNSTRVLCSMDNIIGRTKPACYESNVYSGFKSLNFTHYTSLNSSSLNLEHATRSDIFLGSLLSPHVTAKFHANYYERSQTLQVVGEKLWMLVSPTEFREVLDSFSIGGYAATGSVCLSDLAKLETLQAFRALPGDIVKFPQAWPHAVYTPEGPNTMINFRSGNLRLTRVQDLVAVVVHYARSRSDEHLNTQFCENYTAWAPTSYGHNYPGKLVWGARSQLKWDMRCTEQLQPALFRYLELVRNLQGNGEKEVEIDVNIYNQLNEFLK